LQILVNKKFRNGAEGYRRQHARLVAAMPAISQSQTPSLGQRGDKTEWILAISTFGVLRSHVAVNRGEIQKSGSEKL